MIRKKNYQNEITFILPILERKKFSFRIIRYLKTAKLKLNILVADGSKITQEKYFLPLKKKHNLIFKKFPYDKNTFVFLKKISKSINSVNTKYTALMENDEINNFESYLYLKSLWKKIKISLLQQVKL